MARIRSIHPGLWTDEAFVSTSRDARLLFIGLLNECDDQGAFEWKPRQIKMRLCAADDVDVATVGRWLEELADANLMKHYTANGADYGAVRNFKEWQRPKKPNRLHPMPPEFRTYSGPKDISSEPTEDITQPGGEPTPPLRQSSSEPTDVKAGADPPETQPGGEIPPQMEDGGEGGREKEGRKEAARVNGRHPANGAGPKSWGDWRIVPHGLHRGAKPDDPVNIRDRDRPVCNGTFVDWLSDKLAEITGVEVIPFNDKTMIQWLADGYEPEGIMDAIRPVTDRTGYSPKPLSYFDKPVRERPPTWKPLPRAAA